MKKIKINTPVFYLTLFVLTAITYNLSYAQQITATAILDSNSILIGQQVKLKLSVEYRVDNGKQIKIIWPEIKDTIIKEVEVISQTKIDTIIPDKNDPFKFIQSKTLYITSFDSGYWAVPPFIFKTESDSTAISTEALLLQVITVAVDTTIAIKAIKPPYEENFTFIDWLKDNWLILAITAGSAILLFLLIYFTRKHYKNKPVPLVIEKPAIPAHIIALGKLEQLKTEMLWQNGKLKQYHSQLTDIVREYIENRFHLPALEQTTDEIIFSFRSVAIDTESLTKLKQILVIADLVKFAKEIPLSNENELSMANSYDFVNGTKREETIEKKA